MYRLSTGVPVSAIRGIACSSVVTAVPAAGSLRVTSTFGTGPSVSSIHAIALQRTIGISIAQLLLPTAAAPLSTGMDMALNQTIIIIVRGGLFAGLAEARGARGASRGFWRLETEARVGKYLPSRQIFYLLLV
jgi:hypothetical protein